jgi:hypothetical protein
MTPDDNQPDDLEQRLRDAFGQRAPGQDAEHFLTDVHRGARRLRRRRVAEGMLATAAVVAVAAYGVGASGAFDQDSTNVADQNRTPTTGSTLTQSPSQTATSTSQPSPADKNTRVLSLSATDTDHQYLLAAGKFGCQGDCLEAYTTDDAGNSFQPTGRIGLTPSDPDPTTDTAYGIRFADTDNGWVFGGGLRATHDGGATWTTPDLPVDGIVTSLEAWGDRVLAVVEDGSTGNISLVRSATGSDDWRTVDVGTPVRYVTALALSEDVTAMLGSPTQASAGNQVYVSTDGGDSWTGDRDPCTGKTYPSSVSTSEGALWTVCSPRSGRTGATPYVSTDAGVTWTPTAGSFSPGTQVQGRDATTAVVLDAYQSGATIVTTGGTPDRTLVGQGNYMAVGFTNPATGYLLSFEYRAVRTQDYGATWQPYPTP